VSSHRFEIRSFIHLICAAFQRSFHGENIADGPPYDLEVRVPGYRGPGIDFWGYDIFCEIMGPEPGPLSLLKMTEQILQ
jgi:hypothetical protein